MKEILCFAEYHYSGDIINGFVIPEDGFCFVYQMDEEYPLECLSWGYEDAKKCYDEGVEALKNIRY